MNKTLISRALAAVGALGVFVASSPFASPERSEGVIELPGMGHYATYNYKGGVSAGVAGGVVNSPGVVNVVDIIFDFAKIAAARVAAGQAALAATDVLQVITVQAGYFVPACFLQTLTAEGAAGTVSMGDVATAAGFINAHDLNTVGWSSSLITTAYSLATAGGKLYTAADTINLTINTNAIDVARARMIAVVVDLTQYRQ